MSETIEQISIEDLTAVSGQEPEAGYDAWFTALVQRALEAKAAGKGDYKPASEAFSEFDL